MKKMKEISPESIWNEYLKGENYHNQTGLHDIVRRNEKFYNGEQWEGVNAPDLEKPVINIFKRAVTYLGSQIISDDVGISLAPFGESKENTEICKILSDEIARIVEKTKAKSKNREALRDAAISGDGALYAYFDPEKGKYGEIELETVDNEKIIFTNPYERDIQRQKSILVIKRMMLEDAKELAERSGVSEDDIRRIQPDEAADYSSERREDMNALVTVVIRFWKDEGRVWFSESTRDVFIRKPIKTKAKLYHIAWMPWEKQKDSYHGAAVMTPYIPNQIYVNKMWALAMVFSSKMAWPQRFYDATKIRGGLSNKVGQAIGVAGDPKAAVYFDAPSGNMSAQVLELVDRTIEYTRQSLGVTDAALGDVKPDNTSALIAAAEQTAAPLIFQKLANHQLWEDLINIFIDIIAEMYGLREIYIKNENGEKVKTKFDFSSVDYDSFDIKINIGSATYWSQIMQVQTIDSFFKNGVIDDAITYLEHVPGEYVFEKEKLIEELKQQKMLNEHEKTPENSGLSTDKANPKPTGELLGKINGI